ncbi:MAG TPA: ribonucleoside reductase class II, partial [Firmicutes bacterium]|nr:ribonucleoside reductase class II [Bacillota bacterium]
TPHIGLYETTNPCVPGDTFVLTTEGPRTVKDLIGKQATLIVNGKPFQTAEAGFFSTGTKPLLSIRTREGYTFRATGDHPVLKVRRKTRYSIEQEWVKTRLLKPGDRIMLHNHREYPGWNGLYGDKEGYLIGLLTGDGTFKSDKAYLSVWQGQEDASGIMSAAYKAARSLPHRSDFTGWWKVGGRNEYRLSTAAIKKIALSLGMRPGNKIITPYLETQTSSDFARGFLRGFFDADGSVQGSQEKGISIRLAQSDIGRLQAVQRMLARFGIASSIYANRRRNRETLLPDGKNGTAVYKTRVQHELIISRDNVSVFAERIGFSDTAKQNRLSGALASYRRRLNREQFTVTVEEIVPGGCEEVFDVRVPGINAFDANGIVAHNCGEQPLLPYEACCLGSLNLGKFVNQDHRIDFEHLAETIRIAVRFLDNVIDASNYVIPEIARMHKEGNRKIGLGIMGWHDMLVRLGINYDSEEALETAEKVMSFINSEARKESVKLAAERGTFPNFKGSVYDTGREEDHLRNATRTTIAPTGTIS